MINVRLLAPFLTALALILAACQSAAPTASPSEVMAGDKRMETFALAVESVSMDSVMAGETELTIFAPTVEAFAVFAEAKGLTLLELFASPDLEAVLKNHVVEGIFKAADLSDGQTLTSLAGNTVTVGITGGGVILNGSVNVIEVDIEATNTVIHVIDAVLEPVPDEPATEPLPSVVEIATSAEDFSTLVAALEAADLVDALSGPGPFTVFAPTNDAFAVLLADLDLSADELLASDDLKDILLYHVAEGKVLADQIVTLDSVTTLQGSAVKVEVRDGKVILNGGVEVVMTDIEASNGVVHVIDGVLLPSQPEPDPLPSIAEIASSSEDLSTLLAALKAADLVGTLSGEGPFTVFAPTNNAFAALLAELGISAEDLLASPDLRDILLYHVAAGSFNAADLSGLEFAKTLLGKRVHIQVTDDGLILNGSIKVTVADIQASNGVVHVINGVLLPPAPPEPSLVDVVANDDRFSILAAALDKADLIVALGAPGPFTVFAPTDHAFRDLAHRLGKTPEELLELPNLADILLYHVSPGFVSGEEAKRLESVATLQGSHIGLSLDHDGHLRLNGHIKAVETDISASNGVVHVIDGVLLPH